MAFNDIKIQWNFFFVVPVGPLTPTHNPLIYNVLQNLDFLLVQHWCNISEKWIYFVSLQNH